MIKKHGILGITLIISAYVLNLTKIISAYPIGLILPHYFFIIGAFLFLDDLNSKFNKDSILDRLKKRDFLIFKLIFIGIIIGVIFEIYGVFISNLWYSYFNSWPIKKQMIHYPAGILVGYGLPSLVYYDLYKIISKFFKKNKIKKSNKNFRLLFLVGIMFLSIPLLLYPTSLSWNPIFRGFLFALCLLGFWFILEYFGWKSQKKSFLMDLLNMNIKPLFILLLCSLIISVSWENLDFLRHSWVYQTLPFMNITLLGLPLAIILGWPLLLVVYFSFYELVIEKGFW